jgi:hypothetical protein
VRLSFSQDEITRLVLLPGATKYEGKLSETTFSRY